MRESRLAAQALRWQNALAALNHRKEVAVQTIGRSLTLSKNQWTLLHAVAESMVLLGIATDDVDFLLSNGLIEPFGETWRVTENGHLLTAMRRQI